MAELKRLGSDTEKNLTYARICKRAYDLGCTRDTKMAFIDALMDVESADRFFNINLAGWLKASDEDFIHDFCGIRDNIVRDDFPATDFGDFVPRFANKEEE